MLKQNFVCENLSYSINNKNLFAHVSLALGQEKTGFVGRNGIGKTTLVRILTGELQSPTGSLFVDGRIGYLSQDFSVNQDGSIATLLGVERKLVALEKVDAGTSDQSDFEIVGDDWDVRERVVKALNSVSLGHLDLSRKVATLSGGETTRLLFARLLIEAPDFLILDEPTNNLDQGSRRALYDSITSFSGGMLIISHDRQLLACMDQIVEMSGIGIKTYGGNYDEYLKQKKVEQKALEQDVIDAHKVLRKTKRIIQQTKEKYEKRARIGVKRRYDGGQPKSFLDYHKNRAEQTKSKLETRTDKQLSAARDELLSAKAGLEQRELLEFDLEATRVHNSKVVLDIQNLTFAYPGGTPIIEEFNLTIVGPKRIALAGPNGSGKSSLLRLIMQQLVPGAGSVKIGVDFFVYLDQRLGILDHTQTVLENFRRMNPRVTETDCRFRLATFLFSHDAVDKAVECLSGGEKMRVALVCIFMSDNPPQLIILDEPTNNMDLESITTLERALKNYKGALIVVSHDELFLKNIGVEETVYMGTYHV